MPLGPSRYDHYVQLIVRLENARAGLVIVLDKDPNPNIADLGIACAVQGNTWEEASKNHCDLASVLRQVADDMEVDAAKMQAAHDAGAKPHGGRDVS